MAVVEQDNSENWFGCAHSEFIAFVLGYDFDVKCSGRRQRTSFKGETGLTHHVRT